MITPVEHINAEEMMPRRDMRMAVVGVGGAGCNSISRLKKMGVEIETIAINTDIRSLKSITADKKVWLKGTKGMGCGGVVSEGERAAIAAMDALKDILHGYDVIFLTVGLGGGTGTGASPVIAEIASKLGAIVVAVATMPFEWERMAAVKAKEGLKELIARSHTVIVLDNNKLLEKARDVPMPRAFEVMDHLVAEVIKSVYDALTKPALISINFQEFVNMVRKGGISTILFTDYVGHDPAKAVIETLNNPFMDVDYSNATGALIHMTIGPEETLETVYAIVEGITAQISPEAITSIGVRVSPEYEDRIRILCVLTGIHIPYVDEKFVKNIEVMRNLNIPFL